MSGQFRHGLVIGKFYPPHAGHHLLIREAAGRSARVTVIVMAASWESIPLRDRVSWLSQEHAGDPRVHVIGVRCDLPTDYGDPRVWDAQVALMVEAARQVTAEPVDAVFTSEGYGEELARRFAAAHVPVDRDRSRIPVSGSQVRADLAGNWWHLAAATRAGLTTRVVVVGAESTGTTTLSRALADHYRARGGAWAATAWVPEHGRDRTLELIAQTPDADMDQIVWGADDFAHIAATQQRLEDEAARAGSPVLVCDTDAFATRVWERRYLGTPPESGAAAQAVPEPPPRAVYLLTDHVGVPFVQDGIRDGEHVRADMTGWFSAALTRAGQPWALLTGTHDERLGLATAICDLLLQRRMDFRPPVA